MQTEAMVSAGKWYECETKHNHANTNERFEMQSELMYKMESRIWKE